MDITSGWDDNEWKRNFRISRPTFLYLCNQLRVKLQRTHRTRVPIAVETKVAIALWRLGTKCRISDNLSSLWSRYFHRLLYCV